MKLLKRASVVSLILLFLVSVIYTPFASPVGAEETPDVLSLNAGAAILLDADTGQILYEKNPDELLGVASMSKMMTEYLVLEAIEDKKITWDQEVKIDSYVHELSAAPELSNVGLTEGENYTVKQLFEAMAVYSGNAAAVALAQTVAGSEAKFVEMMNAKAEEMGLKDYRFVNATGLNNADLMGEIPAGEPTDENLMSARATAKLAFNLLNDYPEILETTSIEKLQFVDGREYPSFNWMLPGLTFGYPGVDGLKTGSTDFAGACFTATATKDGHRVISVVMKCESKNARFEETRKLLDYGFNTFAEKEVYPAKSKVEGTDSIGVTNGKADKVTFSTKEPISVITDKNVKSNYKLKYTPDKDKLDEDGHLVAPVKKGEKVGTATLVDENGEAIQFINDDMAKSITTDVVVDKAVEESNIFVRSWNSIADFFSGLFN